MIFMQKWFKQILVHLAGLSFAVLCCYSCKNSRDEQNQKLDEETYIYPVENRSQGYAAMSRLFATDSLLYMSWVEQIDSLAILKYATLDGSTWSEVETIAEGTDWFVNWADFPQIAVNNGYIFTHYLQKSAPDTYAYDVMYMLKNVDSGEWSEPRKLHTDSTQSEHGFVSVIPFKDGFMASWLDGRTTVNRPDSLKQMTLRAGIINVDGSLGKQWELDDRVCDCCNTAITNTANGPVVVYRDRSDDEIRDISIVRMDSTDIWTKPKTVYKDNWKINGCPVNGPAVSHSKGQTRISWFTASKNEPRVEYAYTLDDGLDFGIPAPLTAMGSAIGRVDMSTDKLGNSYVIFMDKGVWYASLRLHTSDKNGRSIINSDLVSISAERASGFPQIAVFKEYLYISYTDADTDSSAIKMIRIPLDQVEFLKRR